MLLDLWPESPCLVLRPISVFGNETETWPKRASATRINILWGWWWTVSCRLVCGAHTTVFCCSSGSPPATNVTTPGYMQLITRLYVCSVCVCLLVHFYLVCCCILYAPRWASRLIDWIELNYEWELTCKWKRVRSVQKWVRYDDQQSSIKQF